MLGIHRIKKWRWHSLEVFPAFCVYVDYGPYAFLPFNEATDNLDYFRAVFSDTHVSEIV